MGLVHCITSLCIPVWNSFNSQSSHNWLSEWIFFTLIEVACRRFSCYQAAEMRSEHGQQQLTGSPGLPDVLPVCFPNIDQTGGLTELLLLSAIMVELKQNASLVSMEAIILREDILKESHTLLFISSGTSCGPKGMTFLSIHSSCLLCCFKLKLGLSLPSRMR